MIYRIILLLSFISFGGYSFAQTNDHTIENNLLSDLISKEGVVGVAAGYSIDGLTHWKNTRGFMDKKNNRLMTDSTLIRTASTAKPMTAIAVMQLYEKGVLDLDKAIINYIPTFPQGIGSKITARMLLSHTSGIAGYKNAKEAENKTYYASLTDAMSVFQNRDLLFEPGTNYNYTSYGYVVLGVLIERISGLDFETYMKENIWEPAGMKNTSVEKKDNTYKNKSRLYHKKRKKAKEARVNDLSNRIPGGGFHTTLVDLLAFGNAIINHELITKGSLDMMTTPSFKIPEGNPYGLGWFLYGPHPQEGAVFGHGGGQTGANTQIFINPTRKIVTVTLANTSGTGNCVTLNNVALIDICNQLSKTGS